ncbi:ARM repeat-containing protein [Auricularia subglabra TFB-10046 SS5]|nr:ARM repeat-containing protein [Auricularia subglabra TFB-10046 SS5]
MFHNARGPRRDDGPAALRSALLDEFRANKTRKWELRDIFGYIVEFSGDQHGSRFIQQKLESATSEEKQIVFDEIVPESALQLIQDVFGNYVIQKLFEYGTQVQKTALANTMENHILQLSLQMYGCRVVQKAIEYILPEQQASFVKELEAHVLKIVMDANGNHVIQKLIERVSPERLGFVHSFRGSVYELSTHPFGCRVLQRCFEYLTDDQTRPLLDELHKYTSNLMQDQFGNYVVQFVLEHGKPEDRLLIISRLRGQMLHMAKHKFASNVCEKALITADEENQRLLIDEIMTPRADGFSPVVTMMKDQFANYVLQRALSVATGEQKKQLVALVRSHLTNMKRYSSNYTKHLVASESNTSTSFLVHNTHVASCLVSSRAPRELVDATGHQASIISHILVVIFLVISPSHHTSSLAEDTHYNIHLASLQSRRIVIIYHPDSRVASQNPSCCDWIIYTAPYPRRTRQVPSSPLPASPVRSSSWLQRHSAPSHPSPPVCSPAALSFA